MRGLEKLWAVMLQKVQGLDHVVQRVIEENEDELLRIWNHHKLGEDLHTAWKESTVLGELEKLLSRVDQTHPPTDLKRKRDREDDEEALQSLNDALSKTHALRPDFQVTEVSKGNEAAIASNATSTTYSIARSPSQTISSIAESALAPLPPSASVLLDHYFTFTHCWFPILDRPYILKKFYEYTRAQRPVQPETADLAYLWAICAYSQQQTMRFKQASNTMSGPSVTEMRAIARTLIPSESGPFSLGHVQALLLLVLLDMGLGEWTSAWFLVGFAVRALLDAIDKNINAGRSGFPGCLYSAADMQKGGSSNRSKFDSFGVQQKKWMAALQGCFVLDTIVSLRLQRPSHLRRVHLDRSQLLDEDGLEEWEPWNASGRGVPESREPAFVISCFNRLTELCMIVSESIGAGISQTGVQSSSDREIVLGLHSLAEKYPFQVTKMERRPPHQMLLQACHLTLLTTASQTVAYQIQENPVWKFLENLELFEHSWNLPNNCGIPSLLSGLCHTVNLILDDSSVHLDNQALFSNRYNQVQRRLAVVWPDFKPSGHLGMGAFSRRDAPGVPAEGSELPINAVLPFPSAEANFWPTQHDRIKAANMGSSTRAPPVFQYQNLPPYVDSVEQPSQDDRASVEYGAMSIDMPKQGHPASFGTDSVMKRSNLVGSASSPSFDGDEIDALFHEMAQLDTTEWTMDRTQGLKDFGFADDTTFEAFCNDPERLMLSDGYMGPAFNNDAHYGNQSQSASRDDRFLPGQIRPHRRSTFDDIFR